MVLTTTKEKKTKVLSFSRLWALWKGTSEVPGRRQSGERRAEGGGFDVPLFIGG